MASNQSGRHRFRRLVDGPRRNILALFRRPLGHRRSQARNSNLRRRRHQLLRKRIPVRGISLVAVSLFSSSLLRVALCLSLGDFHHVRGDGPALLGPNDSKKCAEGHLFWACASVRIFPFPPASMGSVRAPIMTSSRSAHWRHNRILVPGAIA